MTKLIEREKSVIVAADIQKVETLSKLVKHTCQVKGIGGQGRKDHSRAIRSGFGLSGRALKCAIPETQAKPRTILG